MVQFKESERYSTQNYNERDITMVNFWILVVQNLHYYNNFLVHHLLNAGYLQIYLSINDTSDLLTLQLALEGV